MPLLVLLAALLQFALPHSLDSYDFSEVMGARKLSYSCLLDDDGSAFVDRTHSFISPAEETVIFVHACFGTFQYKRKDKKGERWGFGVKILMDILNSIYSNEALLSKVESINIVSVGLIEARKDAKRQIAAMNHPHSKLSKLKWLVACEEKYLFEFPSLAVMQEYTKYMHANSNVLYLHTKGVRRNALLDTMITEWRRYMLYWTVDTVQNICFKALDEYGFNTCGALKRGGKQACYAGNYWWTKAGYFARKQPPINSPAIDWRRRYNAEEYVLSNLSHSEHSNRHFCTHHTHTIDMGNCHIPPSWYILPSPRAEQDFLLAAKSRRRKVGDCFDGDKLPKNRTKDPATWCHKNGYPIS